MKQINRWVVATRTQNGGPWHMDWAQELFDTYEAAARRAFALNDAGYLHKPVRVTVSPAVQGGMAGEDLEPEPIHVKNISGFRVGEEIVIRGEWFRITNVIEDQNELWAVGLEPVTVEPWDGLFTLGWSVYDINREPDMFVESIKGAPLDIAAVGLNIHTLIGAGRKGYLEWDRLFVGMYFVHRLNENGSLSELRGELEDPLEKREVGFFGRCTMVEALFGYAA